MEYYLTNDLCEYYIDAKLENKEKLMEEKILVVDFYNLYMSGYFDSLYNFDIFSSGIENFKYIYNKYYEDIKNDYVNLSIINNDENQVNWDCEYYDGD